MSRRAYRNSRSSIVVGIEEEGVEPAIEIVMMRDVIKGSSAQIELPGMPDEIPQKPLQSGPARHYFGLIHQDRQCIRNRAILDDEVPSCRLRPAQAQG